MNRTGKLWLLGVTALSMACGAADLNDVDVDLDSAGSARGNGAGQASFISRNLYVGADVDAVIAALASADPSDDLPALIAAVNEVNATDWPARARALAAEIARERPHAVGLQEVSNLDLVIPPLGVNYHADFLTDLQTELTALGLNYTVAAQIQNTVAQPFPGVSLVDRDVIIVDADRVSVNGAPFGKNFIYNIGQVAPGVTIVRGFVRIDATINGADWTIINTHLESGGGSALRQLRAGQMTELVAYLPPTGPAVVLGDLNDTPGSLMYQVAAGAGLTDAWAAIHPAEPGLTCCHASDLSNERSDMHSRIDYVMARGTAPGDDGEFGRIRLLGIRESERLSGPLHSIWPSDHAGLAATLRAPAATALR